MNTVIAERERGVPLDRARAAAPRAGRPLRVLYVAPVFHPAVRYGGFTESILQFSRAIRARGVSLDVLSTNCDGPTNHDLPLEQTVDVQGVPVVFCERRPRWEFAPSADLARRLDRSVRDYDLVHAWSCFSFSTAAAARAARRAGVPYVISPCGSVGAENLARRWWKKQPYWYLSERANVTGAAGLHASSGPEHEALASVVPGAPVFTVPNGIDVPDVPKDASRDPRRLVFLGRLHEIKGLDVLTPALALVAKQAPDVETILAGYDDTGEWAKVERWRSQLAPRPRMRFIGPVAGEAKTALLAGARALVLTSHRESFGQVVLEALACGTPAVVSRNCPWRSLEERGAGIWVENDKEAVAAAILRILGASPAEFAAMSRAARDLAATFRWSAAADAMIARYQEIVISRAPASITRAPRRGGDA